MYAINEIVLLPSIQHIAESLNRQLGLRVGVISACGDLIWLGTQSPVSFQEELLKLQEFASNCLEKLILDPASSMFCPCNDGMFGIAVPVFENAQCSAAVFTAFFYLDEPHDDAALSCLSRREARIVLDLLMEIASEIRENAPVIHQNRESAAYSCDFSSIIGSSAPMKSMLNELELICQTESPVLIQGAPGTGKHLIARTIHQNSIRKTRPFIVMDCSAMSELQLESELFGHKRGAFGGAMTDQPGMFDVANGGTCFLTEIQALSSALQFKLLRLLEYGSFLPIGGSVPHSVNVRIVAASTGDVAAAVENGLFRQDLFYRLSVMSLSVPSLSERREDIEELAEFFLSKISQLRQIPSKKLHPDALPVLMNYDWPGNLSEFENEMERLIILSASDECISPDLINPRIVKTQSVKKDALEAMELTNDSQALQENFRLLPGQTLQDVLDEIERRMISLTLKQCEGNRTKTADILGISRRNLIRKIESLHIED